MGVHPVFDEAAARWRHVIDARCSFVPFPATVMRTEADPASSGVFREL